MHENASALSGTTRAAIQPSVLLSTRDAVNISPPLVYRDGKKNMLEQRLLPPCRVLIILVTPPGRTALPRQRTNNLFKSHISRIRDVSSAWHWTILRMLSKAVLLQVPS